MAEQTVTLVLRGRGSLTFPGGPVRWRTVQGGEPFVVDAPLAASLLASDPNIVVHVSVPGEPAVKVAELVAGALASHAATVDPERPLADLKVAELVVIATSLGLEVPKRPTKPVLVDLITTERDRIAADELARAAAEASALADTLAENAEPVEPVTLVVPPVGDQDPVPTPAAELTSDEPHPPETGVLTLGDLGDSARITS